MRLKSLKEVVKEDPVASPCIFNGLIFNDGALVKLYQPFSKGVCSEVALCLLDVTMSNK